MNKKFFLIIQVMYVVLAIFCLILGIYKHVQYGYLHTIVICWYGLTFATILMLFLRRQQQKNMEKRKYNRFLQDDRKD